MRETLGNYGGQLPGLTLHDLSEFIRRAGIEAGFTVQSEFPNKVDGKRRQIDWVWLRGDAPQVAFELEGLNVNPGSLIGDSAKFETLDCIRVVALYSVTNSHRAKKRPPHGLTPLQWVNQQWPGPMGDIQVHVDTDLFAVGGIEQLQQMAIQL